MEVFIATIEAMVFLFGIGVAGYFILARRLVGKEIVPVLSALALEVALPCLVFSDILIKFDPVRMPGWWRLPFLWIGFTLLTWLMTIAVGHCLTLGIRREFMVSLFYPNAIFVPLAVLSQSFGPESMLITELFLLTLLFPAFLFNTIGYFFPSSSTTSRQAGRSQLQKLLHPVVLATIAAAVIRLGGWQVLVPEVVLEITQALGAMALPLIMLLVGSAIYVDFGKKGKIEWGAVAGFILLKNIVFPAVVLLGIRLLRLQPSVAVLLFLQSAVPPVTAIPVLVSRFGGRVDLTNQFLIASFLASLLTLPVGMWALRWIYPNYF